MHFDPILAERLATLESHKFDGQVFRAIRATADPIAPSLYGGRWARPQNGDPGTAILYTSMERDGAIAEVASFLASLNPIPKKGTIKVARLEVSTAKTLKLKEAELVSLGVNMSSYSERDYALTQEIGSTAAWLSHDSLIAPSARWKCDNLMVFTDNHSLNEKLEIVDTESVDWRSWAEEHGLLSSTQKSD